MRREERERLIDGFKTPLAEELARSGIEAEITGRPKNFYSIYNKMRSRVKPFEEIYDLTAVRIIVGTVRECYHTLGLVHTLYRPIPDRFKDYIATPKTNMYQSLHTTVIGPQGMSVEVQIRTWEMHHTAEIGIAAHWRYKGGGAGESSDLDQQMNWLRQVLDWQRDATDPVEFMENLKIELFQDEIFVFTPKGDSPPAAEGGDPHRLRLRHPHRHRPPLPHRQGGRPGRASEHAPDQRRPRCRSSPRPTRSRIRPGSRWSRPPRPARRSAAG